MRLAELAARLTGDVLLTEKNMQWYSATGVFKHERDNTEFVPQFEERTVIVKSSNKQEAEAKILKEFQDYACDGVSFLNHYEVEELFDDPSEDVIEVTSFIRVSKLKDQDYLKAYRTDLRPKNCEDRNWNHHWYTKDEKRSACYNCEQLKINN